MVFLQELIKPIHKSNQIRSKRKLYYRQLNNILSLKYELAKKRNSYKPNGAEDFIFIKAQESVSDAESSSLFQ